MSSNKEMSILERAGLPDPEKVFDERGHIKKIMLRDFKLYPEELEEAHKKEVERHLSWCKRCQEEQNQQFLPMEDEQ